MKPGNRRMRTFWGVFPCRGANSSKTQRSYLASWEMRGFT